VEILLEIDDQAVPGARMREPEFSRAPNGIAQQSNASPAARVSDRLTSLNTIAVRGSPVG
jgi:hypothetical protein